MVDEIPERRFGAGRDVRQQQQVILKARKEREQSPENIQRSKQLDSLKQRLSDAIKTRQDLRQQNDARLKQGLGSDSALIDASNLENRKAVAIQEVINELNKGAIITDGEINTFISDRVSRARKQFVFERRRQRKAKQKPLKATITTVPAQELKVERREDIIKVNKPKKNIGRAILGGRTDPLPKVPESVKEKLDEKGTFQRSWFTKAPPGFNLVIPTKKGGTTPTDLALGTGATVLQEVEDVVKSEDVKKLIASNVGINNNLINFNQKDKEFVVERGQNLVGAFIPTTKGELLGTGAIIGSVALGGVPAYAVKTGFTALAGVQTAEFVTEPTVKGFDEALASTTASILTAGIQPRSAGKGDYVFDVANVKAGFEKTGIGSRLSSARQRATIIIQDAKGKILTVIDKNTGNKLLPGGAKEIKKGESFKEASLRELFEETGIRLRGASSKFMSATNKRLFDKTEITPSSIVKEEGYVGPLVSEASKVFSTKLQDSFKNINIIAKSDVAGFKFVNPKKVRLLKPSESFPFGRPQNIAELLTGKRTRQDTAFIIEKFVNKKQLDTVGLPIFKPKELKGELTNFVRKGQIEFLTRTKGGQFKKFARKQIEVGGLLGGKIQRDIIFIADKSRFDFGPNKQVLKDFTKGQLDILSGTIRKVETIRGDPTRFIVGPGKSVEKGLFFQLPIAPGGPAYIGVSYLGLGKAVSREFTANPFSAIIKRTIIRGREKAPTKTSKVSDIDKLTFTKKAEAGRELEVIEQPGTLNEFVSSTTKDFTTRLYGKRINIVDVRIVKDTRTKIKDNLQDKVSESINKKIKSDDGAVSEKTFLPLPITPSESSVPNIDFSITGVIKKKPSTSSTSIKTEGPVYLPLPSYSKPKPSDSSVPPSSLGSSVSGSFSEPPSSPTPTSTPPSSPPSFPPYVPPPSEPPPPSFPPYVPPSRTTPSFPSTTTRRRKKRKEEDEVFGFRTFVIKGGEKVFLEGVRPRGLALQLGATEVKKTLRATFGIQKTRIKVQKGTSGFKPSELEFRTFRKRKGKKIPLQDTFIEKRKFRLDTPTEIKEITVARR